MTDTVTIQHGNGGREMHDLIHACIAPAIANAHTRFPLDSAQINSGNLRCLFTTDSHVIDPLFFPGGDIGKLAVSGTANDILVAGGKPCYMSLALILEEGFALADLRRILQSVREEADRAGVLVVTGYTKVVEKGKGDKVYINTACLGTPMFDPLPHFNRIADGDRIIMTGSIADHGVAVMIQREGLTVEADIRSDAAALSPVMDALSAQGVVPHFMTDPTRGGVAAACNEIVEATDLGIVLLQDKLVIQPQVDVVCELLGLDPLVIPSEGRAILIVAAEDADKTLTALRDVAMARDAAIIGRVSKKQAKRVILETTAGTHVRVPMPYGVNLPRIC